MSPPRCAVCATSFAGRRFLRNWWGDEFCEHHATCGSCSRPVPDGHAPRCGACRSEAITIRDEAVRALLRVNDWMAGLGVGLPLGDVPLRFIEADDPDAVANPALTHTSEIRRTRPTGRVEVERSITGVEVVRGLTRVQFSSLLAHELTHAWLFLARIDLGGGPVEEGAAELVRSFWLRSRPEPEAAYRLGAMEENRDPVYGDGYRMVRARYRGEPLASFLASLAG